MAASRSTPQLPHNSSGGGGSGGGGLDELFGINWSASSTSVPPTQGGGATFNPFQQTTTQSNNPWGGASKEKRGCGYTGTLVHVLILKHVYI